MADTEEMTLRRKTWVKVKEESLCSYLSAEGKQVFFLVVQKGTSFLDVALLHAHNNAILLDGQRPAIRMLEFADLKGLKLHE